MTAQAPSATVQHAPATPAKRGPGRPTLSNEELLDTALDLFLDKGFERTSIEAICAAAGMAKRTVYSRYGDKTTLFKAALKRAIELWIVPVDHLRAVESDDLEETLVRIGKILVDNLIGPAGLRLLQLTNAESGRMPEIGVFNVRHGTEPTIFYLADLFRRHAARKGREFPDAPETAWAFLNLVVGGPSNAAAWGVVNDAETIARRTRYSVRLFLHGMLAEMTPADATPADGADERARLRGVLGEMDTRLEAARNLLDEARRLAD